MCYANIIASWLEYLFAMQKYLFKQTTRIGAKAHVYSECEELYKEMPMSLLVDANCR